MSLVQNYGFALISKDILENDSLDIQPWRGVWLLTVMPVGISNPNRTGRQEGGALMGVSFTPGWQDEPG